MSLIIPNTTAQAEYTDDFIKDEDLIVGWILVANNPIVLQFAYGLGGQVQLSAEQTIAPTTAPINTPREKPLRGIRFKAFNPSLLPLPQVQGALYSEKEPALGSGTAFTSLLSPSGATGRSVITGKVSALGAVEAGTGFTAVRTAAGLYTITFDTPFTAAPVMFYNPRTSPGNAGRFIQTAAGGAGTGADVDVASMTPAEALVDCAFDFIAQEVV